MMQPGKTKPALGLLIGIGKPKGKSMSGEMGDEMGGDQESGDDGKMMAARGLRKAIQSGSDQDVCDAFETMLQYCDMAGDADETGEEPNSDD